MTRSPAHEGALGSVEQPAASRPCARRRTMIPPSILSRSKAWVGWPMPCRTKLEASTALEMGFDPSSAKYSATRPGGGRDGDAAQDARGEAAADSARARCDGEAACGGCAAGSDGVERRERQVVDGRGLARDAVVVHGIDAVGGDVHLEEMAVPRGQDRMPSTAMPRRVRSSASWRSSADDAGDAS